MFSPKMFSQLESLPISLALNVTHGEVHFEKPRRSWASPAIRVHFALSNTTKSCDSLPYASSIGSINSQDASRWVAPMLQHHQTFFSNALHHPAFDYDGTFHDKCSLIVVTSADDLFDCRSHEYRLGKGQ